MMLNLLIWRRFQAFCVEVMLLLAGSDGLTFSDGLPLVERFTEHSSVRNGAQEPLDFNYLSVSASRQVERRRAIRQPVRQEREYVVGTARKNTVSVIFDYLTKPTVTYQCGLNTSRYRAVRP